MPKTLEGVLKSTSPLVSVILPVFNSEDYVKESIRSILNQDYREIEVIVIDDGSSDDSGLIINKLASNDTRIRHFKQSNKGLVETLNRGLELSQGKYIARMDADDISLPGRIRKQVETMEANPELVLCGTWFKEVENGDKLHKLFCKDEKIRVRSLFSPMFCHPSIMARADVAKKIRYEGSFFRAEDYLYWVELMSIGKVCNLPEVLLKYRVHQNQVSSDRDKQRKVHVSVSKIAWKRLFQIDISEDLLTCIIFGGRDVETLKKSVSFIKTLTNRSVKKLAISYLWKSNSIKLLKIDPLSYLKGLYESINEKLKLRY